jgi:hypothetical protein
MWASLWQHGDVARAGGGWLERLAFRDRRAVTALFASSTLLEALAGHLTD